MEFKLFTDLIEALGNVADGLKAVVNLSTEVEVALFIGQQFQQHASDARNAGQDTKRTQSICGALAAFRTTLIVERKVIIKKELALYTLT